MKDVLYLDAIREKKSLLKQLLMKLDAVNIENLNYIDSQSIEARIQIDQFNYEVNDAKKMLNLAYESLSTK